jgi:hypothetical protein
MKIGPKKAKYATNTIPAMTIHSTPVGQRRKSDLRGLLSMPAFDPGGSLREP